MSSSLKNTLLLKNAILMVIFLTVGVLIGVYGIGGSSKSKSVSSAVVSQDLREGDVSAIVDGYNIYKKEVLAAITRLGATKEADIERLFPIVLNQIISERLIEAEVAKSGIKDSEEYKSKIEELLKQTSKAAYFESKIAGKITEADLKKEYEVIKAKNEGVKEARARHILVATEEEAKQVISDLKKGRAFEELAKERSSDVTAQNGGDLGYFAEHGEILPAFSEAAFALKKGEYTKSPVNTQLGWHVIKLEDIRDRKVPDFKTLQGNIQNGLVQQLINETITELRKKAKVEMYNFSGEVIPEVIDAPAPVQAPAGE